MLAFPRRQGVLHADEVALPDIADAVGTPTYVYVQRHFEHQYRTLSEALDGLNAELCYAVKANSNLTVLRCFRDLGAGFDIVSGGELQRVLAAGGDPARVMFSGVGKSEAEIDFALKVGIRCFNVESRAELARLAARAALLGKVAPVSVRVNPDVDPRTHPYISTGLKHSKFGVSLQDALALYRDARADPALAVVGVDCHIGSQIGEVAPLRQAAESLLTLVDALADEGIPVQHVDLGGGFGVSYDGAAGFDVVAYGAMLRELFGNRPLTVLLEPGRFLVANGGVLLTRIEYLKPASGGSATDGGKNFAVVDAAMNDLIRPALYQAEHRVEVVGDDAGGECASWDVVGPVCESADFLAHDRTLTLTESSLLAVMSAGAYGMVQSSNYNTRGRPAEVLVRGDRFVVVRRRETTRDQLALELPMNQAGRGSRCGGA